MKNIKRRVTLFILLLTLLFSIDAVSSTLSMTMEFELVNQIFTERGLPIPEHHAYPFGAYDKSVREVASRYRKTMRSTSHGINEPPYRFDQLYAVRLYEIYNIEELKAWVDKVALTKEGVLIFYTHRVIEEPGIYDVTPSKFEEVLDYSVESGIPILTIDEAFKVNGTPRIVFTFDDGTITDYTTVYPMMKARGLRGTSYIITSKVGNSGAMSWQQIIEMYEDGWDIQCHTHTHPRLTELEPM